MILLKQPLPRQYIEGLVILLNTDVTDTVIAVNVYPLMSVHK